MSCGAHTAQCCRSRRHERACLGDGSIFCVTLDSTESINPRTGLRETWHNYYGVPLVRQRGLGSLRFAGQTTAVHTVPIKCGLTLDFYARLGRGDELFVTFHGAIPPSKPVYPRFERVASLRRRTKAMMAFADPTIMKDPDRTIVSSWFLGGPGWDPLGPILRSIRRAQGKTGAKHVAFVGGSGGGFAALRASAQVPGSMAFVQDPQTNLAVHNPVNVEKYFDVIWPGYDMDATLRAMPERFDMVRYYSNFAPPNFVYYAQNLKDAMHVEKHYSPFREVAGLSDVSGATRDGSRIFALYEGELDGHGKITPTEFDGHLTEAMGAWREYR